jgi:hypothetical protein
MRAYLLALLHDGQRNFTELACHMRVLLEELPEPDGTRQACRAPSDDQHADLDALLRRERRLGDEIGGSERRWKV